MKTLIKLCMGSVMAALFVLMASPGAHAAIRLINETGKAFTVEIQTPSERLKDLSLPAGVNPSLDFKTPPGGLRYPLSIILKSPEGEWRWDGQDNGVYLVYLSGDKYRGQYLGYIKRDASLSNWLKVWNATKMPLNLEIFYPNGDSSKRTIQVRESASYNSPTSSYFGASDGPTATPGEKRRFEVKDNDGQVLYKGTTTKGQVFLVMPGSGGSGISVNAVGVE